MDIKTYSKDGELVRSKAQFTFTNPLTQQTYSPDVQAYRAEIDPWIQGQIEARVFVLVDDEGNEIPFTREEEAAANARIEAAKKVAEEATKTSTTGNPEGGQAPAPKGAKDGAKK